MIGSLTAHKRAMTCLRISQDWFVVEMLECRWTECDELMSDRLSFVRHIEFQRFLEIEETPFFECKMHGGDSLNSSQRSTALHVAAEPDAHSKLGCTTVQYRVRWSGKRQRSVTHRTSRCLLLLCPALHLSPLHNTTQERRHTPTWAAYTWMRSSSFILDRSTHPLRRRSPDNQIFLGILCNSVLWRPRSPHSAANANLKPSNPGMHTVTYVCCRAVMQSTSCSSN